MPTRSREVLLDVWVVKTYSGEPRGLDGQALRWCTQDELAATESAAGGWAHRGGVAVAGAADPGID